MNSFCIHQYNKKENIYLDDRKEKDNLYCTEFEQKYYINILKNEKNTILDNCHKYIDLYVENDKNIFNGDIKFNDKSLISYENIFIAVCCTYTLDYITIEMYFLSKLPHIMTNNDIFFNYSSIISKCKKNFNIPSYQILGSFNKDLKNILYNLFDKTFSDMLK